MRDRFRCDVGGLHPNWLKVAELRLLDADTLRPGQTADVFVRLLTIEDIRHTLTLGQPITLQAGADVFGDGTITELCQDLLSN